MKGYSGRLGDTLIGLGILQPHELFEKLTEQVRAEDLGGFLLDLWFVQFLCKSDLFR